jgi:hypothetical protein
MTAEIVSVKAIAQVIYLVRGQRVVLDRDLAALYGVETRSPQSGSEAQCE